MRAKLLAGLVLALPAGLSAQSASGDWPAYGRDRGGARYSPPTGIDPGNVKRLAVAWEYSTAEGAGRGAR